MTHEDSKQLKTSDLVEFSDGGVKGTVKIVRDNAVAIIWADSPHGVMHWIDHRDMRNVKKVEVDQ